MDHVSTLLPFAGIALLLTMAPGLDTAMVLRAAIRAGRCSGRSAALGIGLGCLCWGIAVALGLGALLRASPAAYLALQWTGAAYLFWLGARLLRNGHAAGAGDPAVTGRAGSSATATGSLLRALGGNLLNPKVGLFYMTLLPQFVPGGEPVAFCSFLLACVHVVLAVAWFMVLATAAAAIGPLLRRPRVARGIDLLTGFVFLGFGLEVALSAA